MNALQLPSTDLKEILDSKSIDWEVFRNKNIFITGITGIIGKWLLSALLYADDNYGLDLKVSGLSRNPENFFKFAPSLANDCRFSLHKGDVRTVEINLACDFFIHGATDVVQQSNALETLDTCVNGTKHALAIARKSGAKRFLLLSSGAVYGKTPPNFGLIDEDFIGPLSFLTPDSAYANGKRCSELLCAIENSMGSLETTIARCFAMVGPHLPLDKHFAIGNFIQSAINGNTIQIKGDGSPIRSYLYMTDVIINLLTILIKGRAATAYNVGSDLPISIKNLAEQVKRTLNSKIDINIENKNLHGEHANEYVPSTKRIRDHLGLHQKISLTEAIQRTARWHKTLTL